MRRSIAALVLALAAACGSDGGLPPIRATPPDAPATNDPAFKIKGLKHWYLIGDGLTANADLALELVAPDGTQYVDAWIVAADGTATPIRLAPSATTANVFALDTSALALAAGSYSLILAADGAAAVAKLTFARTSPYYVLVTTDWDFSDPGDAVLASHRELHANHPGVKITHFAGPYSFTDPAVPPARQDELAAFLLDMEATHGDEIGLHIHPWCHFVEHAQLPCVTDQSTVYATDATGYTVKLGAYGRSDFGKLLDDAHALFAAHGLPRPKTFRAGGWTATNETLLALNDKGYVADTSALNWRTIEEWDGRGTGELYRWNMATWAPINDTSQPYHPSETDKLAPGTMPILEVPDNGTMIDYVTLAEMTAIFDANFMGTPLAKPTTLVMGFHPSMTFSQAEFLRVHYFLAYADEHLAAKDTGPVVYTTLADVAKVFPLD